MLSNNNHTRIRTGIGAGDAYDRFATGRSTMTANPEISALLRELGLTEIEADTYLALLQASRGEPVSGYKVAKDMGRDPANLAKTLAALGRQGAVRVVQEKPRLFLPVSPDEFTGQVLHRMAETQQRAVQLLREFESTPAAGTALALAGPDQVLERARLLLGACRAEAQIFASPGVCERLSAQIEELAVNRSCALRIASTQSLGIPGAACISVPSPPGLEDTEATPWLQLVVDREVWLIAQLRSDGSTQVPSGWWGEDEGLAMVLAASLNAMEGSSVSAPVIPAAPASEPEVDSVLETEIEPEPVPVPESAAQAAPAAAQAEEPAEETECTDDEDGFQFILRHEEEK